MRIMAKRLPKNLWDAVLRVWALCVAVAVLVAVTLATTLRFLTVIGVLFFAVATSADDAVRLIDVHVHYSPLGPDFPAKSALARKKNWDGMSVADLFSHMDRNGIDMIITEMPPTAIWKGGIEEDYGIPKMAELYPDRVVALYGGRALTMLYAAVEKGLDSADHERKFIRLLERAMKTEKYKGFGEIGLHHMQTVKRANLIIKADHPWMLALADIAAKYDVPIDIHMEATDDNLPALERLLQHNRKTRIVWAHTGWSELGQGTADVWQRLMARHPNLYGSIKHRKLGSRYSSDRDAIRDDSGRIRPPWLRLFEGYPDRFMIGTDIKPGVRDTPSHIDKHVGHMREFLRRLPPHLRAPIARENAVRVFKLRSNVSTRKDQG